MPDPSFLTAPDGVQLAYRHQQGAQPTIVFLPGFNSDMAGSKAEHLARWCAARGQSYLRLDYSGHGRSGGDFVAGSIGRWYADALAVIDAVAGAHFIPVGSSMGGWIALLVARARPERLAGLVGIAAAPDFTERLATLLTPEHKAALESEGWFTIPNAYGPPLRIGRPLFEDGPANLLLGAPIPIHAPVRLLQGQRDPDVPWQDALRIAERIDGADVRVTLIKDGEHRLSRKQDLALLEEQLADLLRVPDRA